MAYATSHILIGSVVMQERMELLALVFGGSAGAHSINLAMVAALQQLGQVREQLVVTHQTGGSMREPIKRFAIALAV